MENSIKPLHKIHTPGSVPADCFIELFSHKKRQAVLWRCPQSYGQIFSENRSFDRTKKKEQSAQYLLLPHSSVPHIIFR